MSTTRDMLLRVARALGDRRHDVVFVGGALPSVFPLIPSVSATRPTIDVDVVVSVATRAAYDASIDDLRRSHGLEHVLDDDAPICRYRLDGCLVDLMPTDPAILGFGNRWFGPLVEHAVPIWLAPDLDVRVADPVHFVATKLEDLKDPDARGEPDLASNRDLEDIVTVTRGVPVLLPEISRGTDPVHEFIRDALQRLLSLPDFDDAIYCHFEPDAATQATVPEWIRQVKACFAGS